ncbi:unnamed protein product [Acanthoscelides obtectus]|uniref:Uncharacterized protein n=1 Tax=Acanthoscelides obtectus TaxID=200917 RepID=A0A9P0MMI7_ACAOB|nr:unnamed protein product [Acanthoscelides obtectus]CAK1641252.1 hypothetical protein AOBTE_LOCUS12273 [Acanthoscelides obtectus]
MNSDIADTYFSEFQFEQNFEVKSLNKISHGSKNVQYPILNEFGINKVLSFKVVDWHDKFDLLLGTDDLQKLGAKIDYTNQTVQLKNRRIPLVIERTTPIKLTRLEYVSHINIPVKIENGPVVVPEFEINGIIFPDCIATARDFHVTIPIPVEHSTPEEICCIEPMDVDPLLEYNIKKPDIQENDFNITQLIRTDHLSPDEKQKILELCQKYKTIFHFEGTDLTCTHHVKHKI